MRLNKKVRETQNRVNLALMILKTIEDPANCEIRSVIPFFKCTETHQLADTAKIQSYHFHTQNHVHHILDQERCHIVGFHTQKQNRLTIAYCAILSCEIIFKTRDGAAFSHGVMVMVLFC